MAKRTSKKECARRKVEIFKIWGKIPPTATRKGLAMVIQQAYQKEAGIEVPRTTIADWIGEFYQGWVPALAQPFDPLAVPYPRIGMPRPSARPGQQPSTYQEYCDTLRAKIDKLREENLQLEKWIANRELVISNMRKVINENEFQATKVKTEQNWWAKLNRKLGL